MTTQAYERLPTISEGWEDRISCNSFNTLPDRLCFRLRGVWALCSWWTLASFQGLLVPNFLNFFYKTSVPAQISHVCKVTSRSSQGFLLQSLFRNPREHGRLHEEGCHCVRQESSMCNRAYQTNERRSGSILLTVTLSNYCAGNELILRACAGAMHDIGSVVLHVGLMKW